MMFNQFKEKHLQAMLPTSYQSNNYLVDNYYYLDAYKYIQFANGSEAIANYIEFFLEHLSEYHKLYDFTKYYGRDIDIDLFIESRSSDNNILFNRLDLVFAKNQLKLLEANINKPTTFSEQVYDQIKNKHSKLDDQINNYFDKYQMPTTIAFVVENGKADSVSSFFILKKIIKNPNVKLLLVENKNILINGDDVYAFNETNRIEQLIYYVPYEHQLYKSKFTKLIKLHNRGKIKILSSPCTIFIQAKGFHALTTKLLEDDMLPDSQAKIVEKYFIKSWVINKENLEKYIDNKDKYIFKPVYGRTSLGIFIGKAFNKEQIYEYFSELSIDQELYIAQELVEIEVEQLPKHTFGQTTYEMTYPVFSAFLMGSNYVQVISRLSKRYITNDGSWTLPITPIDRITTATQQLTHDLKLTTKQKVNFIFDSNFNGFNISQNEYVTNQCVVVADQVVDEMKFVAREYTKILKKTQNLIINNSQRFAHLYSWDNQYMKQTSQIFSILSRVDLIINNQNQIKVLEANVETPAGVVETFELEPKLLNNRSTSTIEVIEQTIYKRLLEIDDYADVIALITLDYYEDMYNINPLKKAIKRVVDKLGIKTEVEIVTIQNLQIVDQQLQTYDGRQIKVLYRYFPLDWLTTYPHYKDVLTQIEHLFLINKLVSLTPNESIISQHKSINAIIYQLLNANVYTIDEQKFIKRYIPFTAVNGNYFFENSNKQKPFLTKSTLGREGSGIHINVQREQEVIFQEMENISLLEFSIVNTNSQVTKAKGFPVYGVYVSDSIECGIYTRISDQITNKNAYYLPLVNESALKQ